MAENMDESQGQQVDLHQQLGQIRESMSNLSGCLSDLNKNRKRWLVTGVVLNSVLTPTLRTYVTDSLEQIYQDLKVKSNIDTQLYPKQLTSYLSTFLNYEAINGNKTWGLKQQSRFNYKVKDAVDLSKLFLKTHMAHYNAFDDSCDAFALLEIIIGCCPAASQACAKKVKDEVRNPWAHCDFTAWDDNKYKTCMELIKDLIESLSLPDQREIIITLQKWVQNGEKFIDGTSPEFVVLGEIQTQVQAVLSCIERIASDTPNQIPKLKEELTVANQSLSELLKRVDDLEMEMTASINRLEKRMEKYQVHIDRWKKDEETFSVTRATDSVAKLIETNNVVTVVGSSGSGKSSIIHHVALQLESVQKFDLIPFVSNPVDIIQYRDMKKNQLFVIDDLCGKNYIDETDFQAWQIHSDKIEKLFPVDPSSEQGKLKILVSCRLQISKNEQFKQLDLFSKEAVDLQSEKYCLLPVERSTMIGNYIKNKIPENRWQDINDKLADCHFFPLLCKLARGKNIHQLHDLFSSPIHSIRKDIKDMILKNPMENCALVLCVLFPGGFHEDFIDPETRPQNVQQKVTDIIKNFKEVTLDNERDIEKFRKTFERLDGTYVKKLGPSYTISHDKICDMVAVEGSHQVTKLFLKYAPSTLIAQLYRLKSVYKVDDNDILIYLNENYQNLYFDRIIQDLKQVKSYQPFFHNQQLKEEKYRKKVMEYIQQNKESCDELFRRLDQEGMTEERKYYSDDTYTYRTTPVIEATKTGFYDLVQYFIKINCDCNKKDNAGPFGNGNSPLYYSCENGFVKVIDLLIRQGVEYRDDLVRACRSGKIDGVRGMIDGGVDLSVCHSEDGETPLTAACCNGRSEIVKLLLDKGADPLQCESGKYGSTALTAACRDGNSKIVKLLLDKGADPLQCESGMLGWTPLTAACRSGGSEIVKLLLDKGADPLQCDSGKDGQTPLTPACLFGHSEIVKLLLDKGADPLQCDSRYGWTPLTAACRDGNSEVVKLLLDKGADPLQRNRRGDTALDYAREDTIINLLESHTKQCSLLKVTTI